MPTRLEKLAWNARNTDEHVRLGMNALEIRF